MQTKVMLNHTKIYGFHLFEIFSAAGQDSGVNVIIFMKYVTFTPNLFWQNGSNYVAQRIHDMQAKRPEIQKRIQMKTVKANPASTTLSRIWGPCRGRAGDLTPMSLIHLSV